MKKIIVESCRECPCCEPDYDDDGCPFHRCSHTNESVEVFGEIDPDCPLPDHVPDAGKMIEQTINNEGLLAKPVTPTIVQTCDACGCHPSIIYYTERGTFCRGCWEKIQNQQI